MVYLGHIEQGKIVMEGEVTLPEGAKVRIHVVENSDSTTELPAERTFLEKYAKYIGIVDGMPSDLAKNHDHYLYGTPKE